MPQTVAPKDAQPPLVLTIDVGTSSVRAFLYDAAGRSVEGVTAGERYTVGTGGDGTAQDDAEMALARIARCVDGVLAQAGPLASAIGSVSLDTLVSNIVALDGGGRPLSPLILYADTRNADDAVALRREMDERVVHDRTGAMLRTSYWPARLAWFRRTQPAVWRDTAQWSTLGAALELRLFGRARVSTSVASWTGLLDRRRLVWDAPLLAALDVAEDRLPPLADASEPIMGLAAPYASRWPALRDVPWFPAIGDGAAANIGSGCTGPSRLALTIGTTAAMRVVMPEVAAVPFGLWCYRVDARRALLGGATSEGGNVYAWARQTLNLGAPEAIEAALATLAADGHGLTVLPLLAGERSPGWAGDAKAAIAGLTLGTTPTEILRASLEAVAYRMAIIARSILAHDGGATQVVASGGALLSSPTWLQIMADVLGRPIFASAEDEATARGTALLALAALRVIPSIDALPAAFGAQYAPDGGRYAVYQAAIERQRQLYTKLIEG
ncbi:MAG: gluconokinase [Anaerolineae bacterium]